MERFRSLLILVFILCKANLAQGQADSYYELWTSKFKAVQLEMQVLSGKVIKAEKQITKTRSDLTKLGLTCSANQQVSEGQEEVKQKAKDDVDSSPYARLQRAFVDQKLYIHNLEKSLRSSSDDLKKNATRCVTRIDELEAKHGESNKELEAKHVKRIDELEANHSKRIDTVEAKYYKRFDEIEAEYRSEAQRNQIKFDESLQQIAKILEVQERQKSIDKEMQSKIRDVKAGNTRLGVAVTANTNAIDTVGRRRCQSGTFGTEYDGSSYPKTYRVNFHPEFERKPKFVYGLRHLDASSIVRIKTRIISINYYFAKVSVGTWTTHGLHGAQLKY